MKIPASWFPNQLQGFSYTEWNKVSVNFTAQQARLVLPENPGADRRQSKEIRRSAYSQRSFSSAQASQNKSRPSDSAFCQFMKIRQPWRIKIDQSQGLNLLLEHPDHFFALLVSQD